ncbi:MAG: hypothetical protein IPK02_10265 [Candidatus Accumulibacter sp.]|uniref:Uncharacterized protein n=1 Tax=Candidatus Accumulibacter affinis TaxID=2954384 RepID=A0A935THI6_9PROT|nr:hypothetical protein [Candidatus Accumulibacter affinis]
MAAPTCVPPGTSRSVGAFSDKTKVSGARRLGGLSVDSQEIEKRQEVLVRHAVDLTGKRFPHVRGQLQQGHAEVALVIGNTQDLVVVTADLCFRLPRLEPIRDPPDHFDQQIPGASRINGRRSHGQGHSLPR